MSRLLLLGLFITTRPGFSFIVSRIQLTTILACGLSRKLTFSDKAIKFYAFLKGVCIPETTSSMSPAQNDPITCFLKESFCLSRLLADSRFYPREKPLFSYRDYLTQIIISLFSAVTGIMGCVQS